MSSSENDEDDEEDCKSPNAITRSNRIDKILDPFLALHRGGSSSTKDKNSSSSIAAVDLSPNELREIRESLEDGLRHRSQTCLICIETLKSVEAIWSCVACYSVFHLGCIQRWARHGLAECELRAAEDDEQDQHHHRSTTTTAKNARWYCPKCRNEYDRSQCPSEYRCFCGQVKDPKSDPWLLPHSCGQTCRRRLGGCEHTCLLLCHPGPCPPCPKTVMVTCHCGKMAPTMRRCGQKSWSCGKECAKTLACGAHKCEQICHAGPCDQCTAITQRRCMCGRHNEKRPCADGRWRCETVCGRSLNCGRHTCQDVCHDGACEPCGGGDIGIKCPCGKTVYDSTHTVSCIDELRPCGDTCGKLLNCGSHYCVDRCHKGECPPCMQMIEKRCRCGLKEKTMPCSKEFLCDVKCKQKRQCGRHMCNRRCCDGQCQPCEQVCGRTLQCGKHKCQAPCHRGLCYPCVLTSEVKCRCGQTKIKIPCGAEKRTKPPRCRKPCSIPPDCHHEKRDAHACHFGDCPPCRQICSKRSEKCGHSCEAICHTSVLVDVNAAAAKRPASSPLDRYLPKFERIQLSCPPCKYPIPIICMGKHEKADFPCSEAKPYGCGRPCGRPLACGNHKCSKLCHAVEKDPCQECTESCTLSRPQDCTHPCTKACHPAPCATCRQMLRKTCHCGLNQKYVSCVDWSWSDETTRRQMLGCGNPCPKFLACGHQCTMECHEGVCSPLDQCERKVTIRCRCGRRSGKAVCSKIQKGQHAPILCDDECKKLQESRQKKTPVEQEEPPSPTDEPKDPMNLGPRRRRKQKQHSDDEPEESALVRLVKEKRGLIVTSVGVVVIAVFAYWLLGI